MSKPQIPLSVPLIKGNEWKYVQECLQTGWVSSAGSYVQRFEREIEKYVEARHAVATVNGTAALHLGLLAAGVRAEDEVIVPALTFIAPVNAVMYCKATPVFMDCDESLCMDMEKLGAFVSEHCEKKKDGFTYNKKTGRRVKAVLPVHVFGHPADMDSLMQISSEFNIDVIEDATESLGSLYQGKKTGSFGKASCFSFNGNKIITTGGGGMLVTNDPSLAQKARHLSTQAKTDDFQYDHDQVGYNYRLTNLQAAMGVAQMERLDEFVSIKRKNLALYCKLLEGVKDVSLLGEAPNVRSNFWFYTLKVPAQSKAGLMKHLLAQGIQVRPIWKLIHTLPMYKDCETFQIEKAPQAYDTCINLPCSVGLTEEQVQFVSREIGDFYQNQSPL